MHANNHGSNAHESSLTLLEGTPVVDAGGQMRGRVADVVVERLRSAGIRHTVLAPNGFMQDVLRFAAMVQEESALLLPALRRFAGLVRGASIATQPSRG